MTSSMIDHPPGKILRFGLGLPVWLYRMKVGWLLGNRFLMLTHRGRKSGRAYETVIEVVHHDKKTDTYYVVSGWGNKSDWYQNVQKSADVTVHVAGRKFQARAHFIPLARAIEIMEGYASDHSLAFRELSFFFLGEHLQANSDAPRRLAEKMPMVAFSLCN
jgi:deazaflavin-dependent oxidoreductase (nitroreductase family)